MNLILSLLLPLLAWLNSFGTPPTAAPADPAWVKEVGAKSMPATQNTFLVAKYGAVADGKTLNTQAIQKAIDAAAKKGGIVTFAPGQYLTGSIFLKKGVTLHIPQGVTLLGSQELKDYPEIPSRIAGVEMVWPAALINILDQENVAITGQGTVDGQGKPFWEKYWAMRKEYDAKGLRWIVDYDAKRPRTLLVSNSSNVTLEGITLQRAGFWTVHILYSKHVTADGLVVRNNIGGHGPSTDGIDIDSSSYVLVQNCDIDCNDDNFCLKAGRDWDGLRVNRPTEYILIQNCVAGAGDGLFTCGSETSGGIRHVIARGLKAKGTKYGIRLKSATNRGGVVEDIVVEDIQMDGVRVPIIMTMNWNPAYSYSTLPAGYTEATLPEHWKKMLAKVEPVERGTPHFRNVRISNLRATGAGEAISAEGLAVSLLENFTLEDISITGKKAGKIDFAQGWSVKGLDIKAENQEPVAVQNSAGMKF
ncbi:glycoside hydrolase family 28 protein [Microvirga sp. STR05]|uniref:Glycoside hydrolase family 28 protein n=1 Tax=Hymenobacter duratus TaxID=2771356 RepID=A0ABR8JHV9_9BACT|nr:glycoside hydrolase family 28 protein [Hymenobacter duratus]MBD2716438.1 glycoside hydrolase family 28 protein [Hymenobacter duratus]MBR7951353.1 glycoside hydrolase family 28 protein [Microvirga sp. STR05]